MPIEIYLPRLGWTMKSGTLVRWIKQDGDHVRTGDVLFTVEADKAVQDVEATDAGILRIPPDAPAAGQEVPVGTLLAYLLQAGESLPWVTGATTVDALSVESRSAGGLPVPAGPATSQTAPERLESQEFVDRRSSSIERLKISPRARRMMAELGVDSDSLVGSGSTGRIVARDVLRATHRANAGSQERAVARRPSEATWLHELPAPPMLAQAPASVTLVTEVDVAELMAMHERLKADLSSRPAPIPTFTDLVVKLVGAALLEHPGLNACWGGAEIIQGSGIHIGIVHDKAKGSVPLVIRDVPAKSIKRIAEESHWLAEKAEAGQLDPADLVGGTFSIIDLGAYEIDAFTPRIISPQLGILGLGRIVLRPAVHRGEIVQHHMITLSLTFDHRGVDGAPAARFLSTVREFLTQPYSWLVV